VEEAQNLNGGKWLMTISNDLKCRLLWSEIQQLRQLMLRVCQWGVTVLVTVQFALYYIRRDLLTRYLAAGTVRAGEPLPLDRYLLGTSFLFILACIFSLFASGTINSYYHYRDQLSGEDTGITLHTPNKLRRVFLYLLFFIFPLMDLLYRKISLTLQ
jgi:hypothetical protein